MKKEGGWSDYRMTAPRQRQQNTGRTAETLRGGKIEKPGCLQTTT
jgi:hypothetical protein